MASQIVLSWQAEYDSSPTELGVWARRVEGPAFSDSELGDQLLWGLPPTRSSRRQRPPQHRSRKRPTSGIAFRAHVDRDPRVSAAPSSSTSSRRGHRTSRASYQWALAQRRRHSVIERSPRTKAGSRSRILTAWLRKGENEIRFFPSKATPYGVRNLRIVGVPHQRIETARFRRGSSHRARFRSAVADA